MEITNWKCPKCETVNTGNFCVVCGCQKPPANFSGNTQDTFNPGTQFGQPTFGGAPQPGYQNPTPPNPTGMPVAGTPYPTGAPMTGTPVSNPTGMPATGTPVPNPTGTPAPSPASAPKPSGPVSSTDLAPTVSKSGPGAGKIVLTVLMYALSVVLIIWVSIAIGTALLAASVGYTVRLVNQSKNEKLKAEAERKRLDSKR